MCSVISVRATTLEGEPHPNCPKELVFEVPDHFTPEYPACTCWIGNKDGDGKTLRHTFADTILQPMLEEMMIGKIIIEIR